MSKPRLMPLRINLAGSFLVIVFLSCILVGLVIFLNIRGFVRDGIKERLRDAATLAVLQIDADAHREILTAEDEEGAAYSELRRRLQTIRRSVPDIRFVYTMRKLEDGVIVFVVDAEESADEKSSVGDQYEDPSPEMLAAFRWPYVVQVESTFTEDAWGTWLSSYAPFFTSNGDLEGIVGLDMSAAAVLAYEHRLLAIISTVSLLTSLVISVAGVFYSRTISRPILHLSRELSKVRELDLDSIAPADSRLLEIARMNEVLMDVKYSLGSFRKYVPAELVNQLMELREEAAIGGERRTMTVFFSDVANFTSISERLSAEELVDRLGVYFREATGIIISNRGTVDKYIGDAIMAFWGAPRELSDHAVFACSAALQTDRFVRQLCAEWKRSGLPEFEVRMGIATGEVVVGNVGYEKRMNYTVLGDNVNLSSRLEGLNKYYGTRILVSEGTQLSVRDRFETRLLDYVAVKGKTQATPVFELLGERDSLTRDQAEFLKLHERNMGLYFSRQWTAAAAGFETALQRSPGDTVSRMLLDRCLNFAQNPPGDAWTGVVVMRDK